MLLLQLQGYKAEDNILGNRLLVKPRAVFLEKTAKTLQATLGISDTQKSTLFNYFTSLKLTFNTNNIILSVLKTILDFVNKITINEDTDPETCLVDLGTDFREIVDLIYTFTLSRGKRQTNDGVLYYTQIDRVLRAEKSAMLKIREIERIRPSVLMLGSRSIISFLEATGLDIAEISTTRRGVIDQADHWMNEQIGNLEQEKARESERERRRKAEKARQDLRRKSIISQTGYSDPPLNAAHPDQTLGYSPQTDTPVSHFQENARSASVPEENDAPHGTSQPSDPLIDQLISQSTNLPLTVAPLNEEKTIKNLDSDSEYPTMGTEESDPQLEKPRDPSIPLDKEITSNNLLNPQEVGGDPLTTEKYRLDHEETGSDTTVLPMRDENELNGSFLLDSTIDQWDYGFGNLNTPTVKVRRTLEPGKTDPETEKLVITLNGRVDETITSLSKTIHQMEKLEESNQVDFTKLSNKIDAGIERLVRLEDKIPDVDMYLIQKMAVQIARHQTRMEEFTVLGMTQLNTRPACLEPNSEYDVEGTQIHLYRNKTELYSTIPTPLCLNRHCGSLRDNKKYLMSATEAKYCSQWQENKGRTLCFQFERGYPNCHYHAHHDCIFEESSAPANAVPYLGESAMFFPYEQIGRENRGRSVIIVNHTRYNPFGDSDETSLRLVRLYKTRAEVFSLFNRIEIFDRDFSLKVVMTSNPYLIYQITLSSIFAAMLLRRVVLALYKFTVFCKSLLQGRIENENALEAGERERLALQ